MTPQELKDYLRTKTLPDTLQLYPGTTIANMEGFLTTSFANVENHKDYEQCPSWWRLLRLYEIVSGEEG